MRCTEHVRTHARLPVPPAGTVKGLTPEQLEAAGAQLILGNTYHLESAPGSGLVAAMGGLHDFIGWRRAMLTDSGGFQAQALPIRFFVPGSPAHSLCRWRVHGDQQADRFHVLICGLCNAATLQGHD